MLHDLDAPAAAGRGDGCCGGVVHGVVRGHSLGVGQGGGSLSQVQVGAAAVGAGGMRAAVVVTDALGRGAAQLLEVLSQVIHVRGVITAQCAQLIVRRLKGLVEQVGIKIIPSHDILFAWLLHLDNTGYDEEDEHYATGHANDGDVHVVQFFQDT